MVILATSVVVIAGAAIGAIAGAQSRDHHWKPLYNRAVAEAAHSKAEAANSKTESEESRDDLLSLQEEVKASVGDLERPQFTVWNVRQSLDASH
jgi:hypothetical protein